MCPTNEGCICIPDADECFIRKQSYEKAIDDFAEKIAEWCEYCNGNMKESCAKGYRCKIYEIAEQLKGEKQ